MTTSEALKIAEGAGLDLVEVSPTVDPPVCRVMNFGKYQFELNKKVQANRRKQKQIHVKEVKFRPTTEENDYQIKLKSIQRFLSEGDKAKVTLRFRGRELLHQELGVQLLNRIQTDVDSHAVIEQTPRLEGRQIVMILAPRKK
ncbi:translation initiation factor IF-3 [mine drainage metagenome]|uniref:Translation initiation factor IF-3 n=1 Tax=mine drainage metagenome TaxID=410659 RepID=T1D248_9ZZZZ